MPYEWQMTEKEAPEHSGASSFDHDKVLPLHQLTLWPYRSLSRRGFVWFIGITVTLISIPLMVLLGTKFLWFMLPFLAAAVGAIWYFLERSYKDGEILEVLAIWPDHMELTRQNPRSDAQHWSANPYWVTVHIHPKGGPVEHYITLRGDGREVELGAFLSVGERKVLLGELRAVLAQLPR